MALTERIPTSSKPRFYPQSTEPARTLRPGGTSRPDLTAPAMTSVPSLEQLAMASELASELVQSPVGHVDAVIQETLERLGRDIGADRAMLILFSDDGRLLSAHREWCIDPLEPLGKAAKGLSRATFGWTLDTLSHQPFTLVRRDEKVPPGAIEQQAFLRKHGHHSQLSSPLTVGGRNIGLLCFAKCRRDENWDLTGIHLTILGAAALATAIDRKRSSIKLENNQKNLDALLDGLDDYLFILDNAGRILHANPPAVRALGYSLKALRGKTLSDIVPPGHSSSVARWLADHARGHASTSFLPLVTSSGVHIPVESKITKATWNNYPVWLSVSRDITDRIQALDGLRRYQAQTMAILEAIPDTILRLRRDGSIIDWIRAADPSDEAPLKDDLPTITSSCRDAIKNMLENGEMQVMEVEFERQDTTQVLECRLVAFGEEEILAVVRDISQRANLEQMKTDFINRASHDLRTPLTTARLMVDLIQGGGAEEELREYWRILDQELRRQNELISTILTVGRHEQGKPELTFTPQPPAAILERSLEEVVHIAGRKGVEILTTIPAVLPRVNADRSALQRTFTNLLDNAVKYTPSGGTIRLEAQEVPGGLSIAVVDSGIGIAPEDIPHLFNRFFRANNAIRTNIQGAGIGLSVVKSIVEAHQGRISVESLLGRGTTFSIWLPMLA